MRRLLLFIIILFGYFFGFGQKYIQVYDASGTSLSQASLTKIENAIDSAIAPMTFDERSRFKVYDIGFYAYDTNKVELPYQMFNTWADIIDGYPESDYYVIFGRVNSEMNLPEEILVKVKLPDNVTDCYSSDDKFALDDIIYNEANSTMSYDYSYNVIDALKKLSEKIEYGLKCACYDNGQIPGTNPNSELCKSKYEGFKSLDDKLRGLGFRRKQIEIGSARTWNNEVPGIYDYFGMEVKINGIPYYIPDEIKNSKAIFESPFQEIPDTSFQDSINTSTILIPTSLQGKVFILDDSSFVNGEWNDAFAESQNLDYCEYWVVLTAPNDIHYLYSRYTVGGQMIPVAMMRKENEIKDRAGVTLSPWGMALKALGNCALDACINAAIDRFTNEKTNDWGTAFKNVDYLGAAWEGLSSLLPWKKSPYIEKFSRAIVKGITIVVDKAVANSSYTVQQGLDDFLWAVGVSVVEQIVGEKAQGLAAQGFARFVKYCNNGTVNKIVGRCFSGITMNFGCFTEDTPVLINDYTSNKIKDIKLNDQLISYNTDETEVNENNYTVSKKLKEYQVDFHSIDNLTECKLILNESDLINYEISGINDAVLLFIPDQGIDGTFIVDKIEISDQKEVPRSKSIDHNFEYSRVTGIFAHNSNDVWKLKFDNGEELKVTSSHPFLSGFSDAWIPVADLLPGDVLRTKQGITKIVSKEAVPGLHKVYNLKFESDQSYLVGENALVPGLTCGDLDKLADRFINNYGKQLKIREIGIWWAKGFPDFFVRGTFFERLMAKTKFVGYTLTAHNWKVIDFYKKVGNKFEVISMKTTYQENVSTWMSTYKKHLEDLNDKKNFLAPGNKTLSEVRKLYIFVKDPGQNNNIYSDWASEIQNKYKNITVVISTVEKALGF